MNYVLFKLDQMLHYERMCLKVAQRNIENVAGRFFTAEQIENNAKSKELSEKRIHEIEKAINILIKFK